MVRPVTPLWSTSWLSWISQVVWASGSVHSSMARVTCSGVSSRVTWAGYWLPPARETKNCPPRVKKEPDWLSRADCTAVFVSTEAPVPVTVYCLPSQVKVAES